MSATHSNIEAGWPGAGNIDVDPDFVNPATDDYRIRPGDPCIDAGLALSPAITGDFDIDGRDRIIGPAPDIGAHEAPCRGDANEDGAVNFDDLNLLLDHWGDIVPRGANGDVDFSSVVDFADLNLLLDAWGAGCGS
ncbi:MAG: choice-of-anchor Q domain-containing protein [Phycisphaerales bacterium]